MQLFDILFLNILKIQVVFGIIIFNISRENWFRKRIEVAYGAIHSMGCFLVSRLSTA
jgi:hypothetical protein